MNNLLNEKAMLTNLSVSMWTGRKYDKTISDEIDVLHASKEIGRFNKILIKKEALAPIQKIVSAMRIFHEKNSLPWQDRGDRLLPSKNYFKYMAAMQSYKFTYEAAVSEFINQWDDLLDEARIRLNGTFNINEYPDVNQLKDKFGSKVVIMPVPEADFRVALDPHEISKIKGSIEEEINTRLKDAVGDTWKRISSHLKLMKARLTETKEGKGSGFRDSLFTNIEELIDILPRLNVTEDPNIDAICAEMQELTKINPTDVRKDDGVKLLAVKQVDDIYNKFKDFF